MVCWSDFKTSFSILCYFFYWRVGGVTYVPSPWFCALTAWPIDTVEVILHPGLMRGPASTSNLLGRLCLKTSHHAVKNSPLQPILGMALDLSAQDQNVRRKKKRQKECSTCVFRDGYKTCQYWLLGADLKLGTLLGRLGNVFLP